MNLAMERRMGWGGLRTYWSAGLSALALVAAAAPCAWAQEQTQRFDIASQPLSAALLELGRQARMSILAPSELVEQKMAPDVRGDLTLNAALSQLLAGSGLRFEFVQPNAVRILRIDGRAGLVPADFEAADAPVSDRVVVTGTNIRGVAPSSSPVDVYTSADIAATGAATTEQFVGKLPQNLGTLSQFGAGSTTAGQNNDGVTSVDLRGLGVGTTLTLLNGRRLAPSNSGQSIDVSLIPAGAIDRVEVLTDGASAIYGSDAVGGVINFVLRDDFVGSESRLAYGGVSSGNLRQGDVSQTFGNAWGSGNGLVSYTYHSASALLTEDRDFASAAGPGKLTPDDVRHNLFASLSQDVGERFNIAAQFGGSLRDVKNEYTYATSANPLNWSRTRYKSSTDQYFGSLSAAYDISETLTAEIAGSFSGVSVDGERVTSLFNRMPAPPSVRTNFSSESRSHEITAKLDGVLFQLPGGPARFSLGAGLLGEEYQGINLLTTTQSSGELARRSPYAFGEVFLPLIGRSQQAPLAYRLEVSLAARYTDYQDHSSPPLSRDFGESTDPKIGILWAPVEPLNLRATYGTSFRAPSLTQIDPTGAVNQLIEQPVAGIPSVIFALVGYAPPDLGPETAETYTVGFDYDSHALPGFRIGATYYNIDYTDRIGTAPTGGLNPFANPALLPDVIYRAPSAAFIEEQLRASSTILNMPGIDLSDPTAAAAVLFARPDLWVYDVRYRNLATSRQDGIDVSIGQSLTTDWGDLNLAVNATHIFEFVQQASPSSTPLPAMDIPGRPADWRGRALASFSRGSFQGAVNVNYTDGYTNPWTTPAQPVKSWTTVDLTLGYDFRNASGSGPRLSLSIQNLFDRDPPLLNRGSGAALVSPVGFDPANANPLKRFIMLGLVQKW